MRKRKEGKEMYMHLLIWAKKCFIVFHGYWLTLKKYVNRCLTLLKRTLKLCKGGCRILCRPFVIQHWAEAAEGHTAIEKEVWTGILRVNQPQTGSSNQSSTSQCPLGKPLGDLKTRGSLVLSRESLTRATACKGLPQLRLKGQHTHSHRALPGNRTSCIYCWSQNGLSSEKRNCASVGGDWNINRFVDQKHLK